MVRSRRGAREGALREEEGGGRSRNKEGEAQKKGKREEKEKKKREERKARQLLLDGITSWLSPPSQLLRPTAFFRPPTSTTTSLPTNTTDDRGNEDISRRMSVEQQKEGRERKYEKRENAHLSGEEP